MEFNRKLVNSLIDLTSLNDNDTQDSIHLLCQKAHNSLGNVASICIYPKFISTALSLLKPLNIPITTVINFPKGNFDTKETLIELENALTLGANEIDVVFPYSLIFKNELRTAELFIKDIKKNCPNNILKVILETGELKNENNIRLASKIAIHAGANFLKTSTGKVKINATLAATQYMLEEIKKSKQSIGFKASGGIKTYEEAIEYLKLTANIMDQSYINKNMFRFGASSLLDNLLDGSTKSNAY